MAANNSVILTGNLTKDSELQYARGGESGKLTFKIAVKGYGKDAPTDFIPCVLWGKRAESLKQHLIKGQKVTVEGRIRTFEYEKDGKKIYGWEVVVGDVDIHWTKRSGDQAANEGGETVSESATEEEYPF